MDRLTIDSKIKLNNGAELPMLGFGVWQIPDGKPTHDAVSWALEAGYRHIDTAKYYQNEASVGAAVRDSGIPREEIWVTTKLWPTDQIRTKSAFEASMARLGLDYVDLYLVHWPIPGLVKWTWKAMEEIYASGRVKAIGVSNHSTDQISDILEIAKVPPAVNQVRFSPFDYDAEMLRFATSHNIAIEAYSPLTRGYQFNNLVLNQIAERHHKSVAQILIRWGLQKGVAVLPKAAHLDHIRENADVFDFELSEAEIHQLDLLSSQN